ncbi:MraY family glycosyltransferase [Pedobacter deserti]|uniref:MraY family glycosyltransferase n=1 Tax=Pedobacter deserti TaxID=2817382 RepID=UPI00210BD215|nr:MraY family glycosyltransferase [Pedobacter sp. SYSU D00382]
MLFILIFLTSLLVVAFAIPPVITVAFRKRLFDSPSELRKVHKRIVPNFGGIAIFTGFLFSSAFFIPTSLLPEANLLMAAGLILFMTGLKDDVVGLSPTIKFAAQFANAFIIAVVANLRIENLHGLFNLYELNYYASVTLTVLFIVGVVNAYNLIDGIDGLAASLGVMFSLLFAYFFYRSGELGWAYLSISLTGALIGFLFFNVTPARIFMGDSGSLMIGFLAAVLSLKLLNTLEGQAVFAGTVRITSDIALVLAMLIVPIFDTLRVFTLRILKNSSPFTADSNHLHHRLLFLGLSHMQSTLILVVLNTLFIIVAIALQDLGNTQLTSLIVLCILSVNGLLSLYIERYKRNIAMRELKISNAAGNTSKQFVSGRALQTKPFTGEILEKISEN